MPNKMLIDAAHPEETRVVVLRGNRVEEFDFESASRKQLRGNIYLAKVTRVEPSLQAAFIEYGGNRHGFLAFSEIHPDYYQIPVADRQALIEAEEREAEEAEARHDRDRSRRSRGGAPARSAEGSSVSEAASGEATDEHEAEAGADAHADHHEGEDGADHNHDEHDHDGHTHDQHGHDHHDHEHGDHEHGEERTSEDETAGQPAEDTFEVNAESGEAAPSGETNGDAGGSDDDHVQSDDQVESVGAEDAMEEVPERRRTRVRQYKIQEVIKRRQVLLVQVVKEERGNKGAALTTYLSLAGRYCVLMPNTARGGGISRKITSITDRKRLKQVVSDLEVPQGMGVILRTAGASRTRAEVKRDFEYLLRMWENVRELTLKSSAPMLVYEEGSLIKRSIRDLYNKDIDEVTVAGEEAYREAKDFMRMLMPSHAKNVQPYRDPQPLFARSGIEAQLDAMFSPQVTLRSGGYIVINQTEALVSIDVNSGRSTREHNIEDTALQTNLEAAEEVARQLRLRDLAGLIVIDFIDMEEKRNNRSVERKMKDALKNDRARIQVGRISHFGLLEMSRQRIRTGVLESTTTTCPTCQGTGHVRAPASVALHVLRSLEDQLLKGVTHHLTIRTRTIVALYILNQKRQHLAEIEARFGLHITVSADEGITNGGHFVIERGEPVEPRTQPAPQITPSSFQAIDAEDEAADAAAEMDEDAGEASVQEIEEITEDGDGEEGGQREEGSRDDERGEREGGRRRRRRRGRGRGAEGGRAEGGRAEGGGRDGQPQQNRQPQQRQPQQPQPQRAADENGEDTEAEAYAEGENGAAVMNGEPRTNGEQELGPDGEPRKRRRGRRGGRRGRRGRGDDRPEQQAERGGEPRGGGERPNNEDANQQQPAFTNTYGILNGDDEIDTTPRLDPIPVREPIQRVDMISNRLDIVPDEIDTTPQPEPRSSQHAPQPTQSAEPEDDDPDRPKRSGWWQRKSFFG